MSCPGSDSALEKARRQTVENRRECIQKTDRFKTTVCGGTAREVTPAGGAVLLGGLGLREAGGPWCAAIGSGRPRRCVQGALERVGGGGQRGRCCGARWGSGAMGVICASPRPGACGAPSPAGVPGIRRRLPAQDLPECSKNTDSCKVRHVALRQRQPKRGWEGVM